LPEGIIKQLEKFFKNYNCQAGKKFKVLERLNAAQAARLIK
jgi:inorganic pyrophosphatase